MRTYKLIDMLKDKYSLKSDYAVAKFLSISHATVSKWKRGRECDDEMVIKLCNLLDLNPIRVLMTVQAHRTTCPITKETFLIYSETLPLGKNEKKLTLKEFYKKKEEAETLVS